MSYSTSAIKESIQITIIAKNEIAEIKQEIKNQNDRLLTFQKKNSAINCLLKENNNYIDAMFKKSKRGYLYASMFCIIVVLLFIFAKIRFYD